MTLSLNVFSILKPSVIRPSPGYQANQVLEPVPVYQSASRPAPEPRREELVAIEPIPLSEPPILRTRPVNTHSQPVRPAPVR